MNLLPRNCNLYSIFRSTSCENFAGAVQVGGPGVVGYRQHQRNATMDPHGCRDHGQGSTRQEKRTGPRGRDWRGDDDDDDTASGALGPVQEGSVRGKGTGFCKKCFKDRPIVRFLSHVWANEAGSRLNILYQIYAQKKPLGGFL